MTTTGHGGQKLITFGAGVKKSAESGVRGGGPVWCPIATTAVSDPPLTTG
jgi:hypothetical protein